MKTRLTAVISLCCTLILPTAAFADGYSAQPHAQAVYQPLAHEYQQPVPQPHITHQYQSRSVSSQPSPNRYPLGINRVLPPAPAAVPSPLPARDEDLIVTRYGNFEGYSFRDTYDPYYLAPYTSQTHALHPYYRNSYWTRQEIPVLRNSRPEFIRYLQDLYYSGGLVAGQQVAAAEKRCYNQQSYRLNYRTPPFPGECY